MGARGSIAARRSPSPTCGAARPTPPRSYCSRNRPWASARRNFGSSSIPGVEGGRTTIGSSSQSAGSKVATETGSTRRRSGSGSPNSTAAARSACASGMGMVPSGCTPSWSRKSRPSRISISCCRTRACQSWNVSVRSWPASVCQLTVTVCARRTSARTPGRHRLPSSPATIRPDVSSIRGLNIAVAGPSAASMITRSPTPSIGAARPAPTGPRNRAAARPPARLARSSRGNRVEVDGRGAGAQGMPGQPQGAHARGEHGQWRRRRGIDGTTLEPTRDFSVRSRA